MHQVTRRSRLIIGPDGSPLSMTDLPSMGHQRWVVRRKAVVVAAVRGGLLSIEDACHRYALTLEEFMSWQAAVDRYGLKGLRSTKMQEYRAYGDHSA